jgi:hypothetical protein
MGGTSKRSSVCIMIANFRHESRTTLSSAPLRAVRTSEGAWFLFFWCLAVNFHFCVLDGSRSEAVNSAQSVPRLPRVNVKALVALMPNVHRTVIAFVASSTSYPDKWPRGTISSPSSIISLFGKIFSPKVPLPLCSCAHNAGY